MCEKILAGVDPTKVGTAAPCLRIAMAEAFVMMGRPMKAKELLNYDDSILIAKDQSWRSLRERCLGEIDFLQERLKPAGDHLCKSVELDFGDSSSVADLARVCIAAGNWVGAKNVMDKYDRPQLRSDLPIIGVRAIFLARQGKFEAAKTLIEPLCIDEEANPDLFKGVHLEFDLERLGVLAENAGRDNYANWFIQKYQDARGRYLQHMHIFKQMDITGNSGEPK
jgi:hypothetical protein